MNPSKTFVLFILFISGVSYINLFGQKVIHKNGRYYFADRVVAKFANTTKVNTYEIEKIIRSGKKVISKASVIEIQDAFNTSGREYRAEEKLKNIKNVFFNSEIDPVKISVKLEESSEIEWAEPHYLYQTTFEPNDPRYLDGTQNYLKKIQANLAWDIENGSPDVVIGIDDTGIGWDHPDLAANIWINPGETGIDKNGNDKRDNGIDDDNNGFIDDYHGWDFGGLSGTPDNNPMEDRPDHGTHVAGIAGAVTNNGIGVASIGFNSKIMAVKVSQDNIRDKNGNALIAFGYRGIEYAVDNGAKVINCSWGSSGYSNAAQAVIDYAVANGVIITAAAGNDNSKELFYPAYYNGVLSVAATDTSDRKAGFSNYGINVDVTAPGVSTYSTWMNNTYTFLSGTSMASPVVAGLAALVVHRFPSYNPLQIAEQIRVNSDNIDNSNPGFENMLGYGRINAYKALNNINSKSVRLTGVKFYDKGDGDGIFESGEKVDVEISFENYLSPVNNLNIQLESKSSLLTVDKSSIIVGSMNTLETKNNSTDKFSFTIAQTSLVNLDANLLIRFNDGLYSDYQWITITINPTYATQNVNDIALTINSNGSLGFDDYPNNKKGEGFKYKEGNNLMFEGALMYGTSEGSINDCARSSNSNIKDDDFRTVRQFVINTPGLEADQEGETIFNDDNAYSTKLGIETTLNSFSNSGEEDINYIILRYRMQNKSGVNVNNLYIGLYFDFDIDSTNAANDVVKYDTASNFGYAFSKNKTPTTIIGASLISSDQYGFYAMNEKGDGGRAISFDGFSDSEKWSTLSSGLTYSQVSPGDISFVVSGGPYNLSPGERTTVGFVLAADTSVVNVNTAIERSKIKYFDIPSGAEKPKPKLPTTFKLEQNYPNPFNPTTKIKYSIPRAYLQNQSFYKVTLTVYDVLGKEIAVLVNKQQRAGSYEVEFNARNLPSGIYFYKIKANTQGGSAGFTNVKKLVLLK
ncbi:thermophilic serine proteinase precursor [bacterium BMS3Abin04]|nr:thermophilic serine proteinase precursor [bacterium BMS3Abin04]